MGEEFEERAVCTGAARAKGPPPRGLHGNHCKAAVAGTAAVQRIPPQVGRCWKVMPPALRPSSGCPSPRLNPTWNLEHSSLLQGERLAPGHTQPRWRGCRMGLEVATNRKQSAVSITIMCWGRFLQPPGFGFGRLEYSWALSFQNRPYPPSILKFRELLQTRCFPLQAYQTPL